MSSEEDGGNHHTKVMLICGPRSMHQGRIPSLQQVLDKMDRSFIENNNLYMRMSAKFGDLALPLQPPIHTRPMDRVFPVTTNRHLSKEAINVTHKGEVGECDDKLCWASTISRPTESAERIVPRS